MIDRRNFLQRLLGGALALPVISQAVIVRPPIPVAKFKPPKPKKNDYELARFMSQHFLRTLLGEIEGVERVSVVRAKHAAMDYDVLWSQRLPGRHDVRQHLTVATEWKPWLGLDTIICDLIEPAAYAMGRMIRDQHRRGGRVATFYELPIVPDLDFCERTTALHERASARFMTAFDPLHVVTVARFDALFTWARPPIRERRYFDYQPARLPA